MKNNILKILLSSLLIFPFLLINENDVEAARFVREKGKVVFDYSDISRYLVQVGGELEVTHVDLNRKKTGPIRIKPQLNGKYVLERNGTYTIRQLLPNGRTLGYSFYQTIVTSYR